MPIHFGVAWVWPVSTFDRYAADTPASLATASRVSPAMFRRVRSPSPGEVWFFFMSKNIALLVQTVQVHIDKRARVLRRMCKTSMISSMKQEKGAQETSRVPRMDQQERLLHASRVRPAREALGISQAELAARAGVSRGTVSNIERAQVAPQVANLWAVMGALDMRPDMSREWPEEVESWLRIIAPLIELLPDATRDRIMVAMVSELGRRVSEG